MCRQPSGARKVALVWLARLLRPLLHQYICQQEFSFCRDVVSGVTDGKLNLHLCEDTLPLPLELCGSPVYFAGAASGGSQDARAKDAIRTFADGDQLPDALREKMVQAGWEAITNAIKYGAGGSLRICSSATRLQLWITDRGPGISLADIPHATLRAGYSTGGTAGLGFTLMINFAQRMDLLTTPSGTTILLSWDRTMSEDPRITMLLEKYS